MTKTVRACKSCREILREGGYTVTEKSREEGLDVCPLLRPAHRREDLPDRERRAKTINHDMTHCADYRKSRCPKRCFRARLTQELFERQARGDLEGIPMSFAHLRGTAECWEGSRSDSKVREEKRIATPSCATVRNDNGGKT